MAQMNYGYVTPKGTAGGLVDMSPYAINSRINGEAAVGTLKFGMGVVWGDIPGKDIRLPDGDVEANEFEGIVMNGFTDQQSIEGGIKLRPKQTVGILRYGKAWVRIEPDAEVSYGDRVYLITDGANTGFFTNDDTIGIAVNGIFVSEPDGGAIAAVEIYNAPAV